MRNIARLMAAGLAGLLLLGGCAHDSYREEPHHFSKDSRGHRVACYATDVADEYECVPAYRSHPYAGYPYAYGYDPFYDPYWHAHIIYAPAYRYEPYPYRPQPPPRRWHERPR